MHRGAVRAVCPRRVHGADNRTELTPAFPLPQLFAQEKCSVSPHPCSFPMWFLLSPGSQAVTVVPEAYLCLEPSAKAGRVETAYNKNEPLKSTVVSLVGVTKCQKNVFYSLLPRDLVLNSVMAQLQQHNLF